jgi:hypothetical protein
MVMIALALRQIKKRKSHSQKLILIRSTCVLNPHVQGDNPARRQSPRLSS